MGDITARELKNLCALQCTEEEVVAHFHATPEEVQAFCLETFGETFESVRERYSEEGKTRLRQSQFRLAEKSPVMATWLGRQYLGQSDESELPEYVSGEEPQTRLEKLKDMEARLLFAMNHCERNELAALSKQYRATLLEIEDIEGMNADDELGRLLSGRDADGKSNPVR